MSNWLFLIPPEPNWGRLVIVARSKYLLRCEHFMRYA